MAISHKFRRDPINYFLDSRFLLLRKTMPAVFRFLCRLRLFRHFLEDPMILLVDLRLPRLRQMVERQGQKKRWRMLRRHGLPKVTIIVPAYNAEKTLQDALEALQAQSYGNLEIIVIDDDSTDSTRKIISQLAATDARIVSCRSMLHRGAAHCRNIGLERATGTYVTFQDSDDKSDSLRVELQLYALINSSMSRFSLCNYVRENSDGERVSVNGLLIRKCVISMMFPRQEALSDIGYFKDIRTGEDSDYLERLRIFYGPGSEIVVYKTLYHALIHVESLLMLTNQIHKIDRKNWLIERKMVEEIQWQRLCAEHRRMKAGKVPLYVDFEAPRNICNADSKS